MKMNVYNIVWADDEIDDLLDSETINELESKGFKIIGRAHDGEELESLLRKPEMVDAVIVDANFNESDVEIGSERDTSGLDYARSLYLHTLKQRTPFFLFTNRSDELLREIYKHNPKFLEDFPRHKRWFNKSSPGEYDDLFEAIKEEVSNRNSTSFKVRNRYQYELNAATIIDGAYDFIFEFLSKDSEDRIVDMVEPFVRVRRIVEKVFSSCENVGLIPPISTDTNGTARYFLKNNYSVKENGAWIQKYYMKDVTIMPKPLAQSLSFIVEVTQDGAHSKNNMALAVDKYFEKTKDTLLLKSVAYILIDIVKWFTMTYVNHQDKEINTNGLWSKV